MIIKLLCEKCGRATVKNKCLFCDLGVPGKTLEDISDEEKRDKLRKKIERWRSDWLFF